MQKSTNYGLNLPERNDQYNIDHFNENTAAIDAALHENAVNIGKNANDIADEAAAREAHEARKDNPHNVTKAQVGLGNVPNVSTNNQTPTFDEASSLTNIESGEKLTVLFGKVKKAVSSLISHIANTANPHSVTKSQVGLGSVENKSAATILGEMTKEQVVNALGFTPSGGITLDSLLSTSSANAVQNKVVTSNMYCVINGDSDQQHNIDIDGFVLTKGAALRVLFTAACAYSNPTLKVNSEEAKNIVSYRGGSPVGLQASSGKCWDAYTTLELMYDDTNFVVMGNPVVLSNFAESGYIKYANGLLIQWGKESYSGNTDKEVAIVAYTSSNYIVLATPSTALWNSGKVQIIGCEIISENKFKLLMKMESQSGDCRWMSVGY